MPCTLLGPTSRTWLVVDQLIKFLMLAAMHACLHVNVSCQCVNMPCNVM